MNNMGQNMGAVSGVTGILAGTGITCTPNPISRTGTVSLSEGVVQAITAAQTSTQHITADPQSTRMDSDVSISSLQPISENSTIGTMAVPFDNVYTRNVTTPGTNLNALATSVSNHTTLIAGLTSLTQNQSATPESTQFSGPVIATQLIKNGGMPNQFLMADGSVSEGKMQNASMDEDVVPLTMANASVPANSYDYYIEDEMTHAMTVHAIRIACSTVGADSIRVAIYRFGTIVQGKFILCGQSVSTPATAVATIPIVAQIGQNLVFSKGESFVIGIAVGGLHRYGV